MALKDENGNWINVNGNPIPEKNVPKVLKKRDAAVTRIIKRALNLEKQMKLYKIKISEEVSKYISSIGDIGKFEVSAKGNITLTDYAGLNQVCIQVNDSFEYDERFNMAKGLIDECVQEWSKDANENLQALVAEAFNVDKKGKVNHYMITRLFNNVQVKHPKWKQAKQLYYESQNAVGSRKYIMLRSRRDKESDWVQVNLNFSSL